MSRSVQSIDLFIDKYTPKREVVKAGALFAQLVTGAAVSRKK